MQILSVFNAAFGIRRTFNWILFNTIQNLNEFLSIIEPLNWMIYDVLIVFFEFRNLKWFIEKWWLWIKLIWLRLCERKTLKLRKNLTFIYKNWSKFHILFRLICLLWMLKVHWNCIQECAHERTTWWHIESH